MSITPIGITDWRNQNKPFGIKDNDRFGHIYVIGKTGTGKSTLLMNMAISDIQRGNGLCIIDPHGDIANALLDYIPESRVKDTIYFDPSETEFVIGFNPLENTNPDLEHLVLSGLISTLKKIWIDSWGPRLEYILRYSLLSLLHYPNATLLDIQPLLTDYDFRQRVLSYCEDMQVRQFWYQEFDKYPPALKAEAIAPILNKTGIFSAIKPLRNVVCHPKSSFQIQEIMDTGKILICNLSKGKIGEDACTLLGSFLVNAIQIAALSRASQPENERKPFFLYVDEMHSFVSLSFADILSEARKYKLSLFLVHQYIEQLHEKIRSAILGNVGTLIVFRVGADDAAVLTKEFSPVFNEDDLVNLPRYAMYLKLMIDGASSKPFSATTIQRVASLLSFKKQIHHHSTLFYRRARKYSDHESSETQLGDKQRGNNVTLFDEL